MFEAIFYDFLLKQKHKVKFKVTEVKAVLDHILSNLPKEN